jgi:hypothetical protein
MKLIKYGTYRFRGDDEVASSKPKVAWNASANQIELTLTGKVRTTTHTYLIQLGPDELARIVRESVDAACGDNAIKAFGAATASFLRAALPKAD